ncbi:hypothetical protein [Phenylobacterium sp.]|jgi:uncharacterized protein YukE|uniref:hypothetical protein n=1 Tax=Phenylobacterium sp. TaxID=1871053 RepID=UPI002F95173E
MEQREKELHYRYWLGIVGAIAVLIASTLWSGNDTLFNMISFAAAVSSLILAVIAILMTNKSTENIQYTLASLSSSSGKIESVASSLDRSTTELASKVEAIPSALGDMAERLDRAQETWGAQRAQVAAVVEAAESEGSPSKSGEESELSVLLERAPPGGVMAMYACALAAATGKRVRFEDIWDTRSASFAKGFLRGLHAARVIESKSTSKFTSITDAKSLDKDVLKTFLTEMAPKNSYVQRYMPRVEDYFGDEI